MATRNTIQRQLVLQAVQAMQNHPTADEIHVQVAGEHPYISKATVYRNLNLLADTGQIRRVTHLNAADRFDFQLKPHYHIICNCCGKVFDVNLPYDHTLMARVENPDGFVLQGYEITFNGLCPECCKGTSKPI